MNYLSEFQNPSSMFRGAPFWAWNCKLDLDQLLRQIDVFHEMGLGGFTMHCRTGMATEYMGDAFMTMIKGCVARAKELGMEAHLYDEDRWPSGFAGGLVTKDPAYRSRFLVFSKTSPDARQMKTGAGGTDSSARVMSSGEGRLLAAYDITLENGYLTGYRQLAEGETAENAFYAYLEISQENPWYNNETYVNTLDKRAIERFIETTHDKYFAEIGDEFGKTVPSIFTDEPQFVHKSVYGYAEDGRDIILPYTDDFDDTFAAAYGDTMLAHLPEVLWELPDGQVSAWRYRYHDHLAERFAEAFSDTIGDWCDAHGIKLTGHMMEEPSLRSQTNALGEAMRHFRGFNIPGIDMLNDRREYTTAKQAQSAAHQLGANEVMSELYGVTNWDFDFRRHKLQGDWQAALGVTHRVHHLSWVSMEGEAKRDYPASISYQSPWYREYNAMETYFGRVNTAMRSGKPRVRVGVIHPVESYWLYYGPEEQTAIIRKKLEMEFSQITEWLLFGLLDFDFISESLMQTLGGGESDGGFDVGDMRYDVIVVPGNRTLRASTLERLARFRAAGGEVVFVGDTPRYVDALPSEKPAMLRERCTKIAFDYGELMDALAAYRDIDIHTPQGIRDDMHLCQIRDMDGQRLVFIANGRALQSPDDTNLNAHFSGMNPDVPTPRSYTISFPGTYGVSILDAMTGEETPCAATYENGHTLLPYTFYEEDSLLLRLTEGATQAVPAADIPAANDLTFITALHQVDAYSLSEPNVLMLDQAQYALDGDAFGESEEVLRIDNILRTRLSYPLKMSAVAQPWTDTAPLTDVHTLRLRYVFDSALAVAGAQLAMERPEQATILLNGESVQNTPVGYFTDESIKTLPLPMLRKGQNILDVTMPYSRKTNLEWCYLLGDFGVQVYGNKARLTPRPEQIGFSDMAAQQFPFYAGNVTYHCDVDIAEAGSYVLEVTKFRSPVLRAAIDGRDAGQIAFSPYHVALGTLTPGKHRIDITAYGSRINAFGQVHNADGTFSWFGPNAWRTTGAEFSYEYQLKRTGILAAPVLFKRK